MQQQQQQQQGGAPYRIPPPGMFPFSSPGCSGPRLPPPLAEAASPISSMPPAGPFEDLGGALSAGGGNFPEDEAFAAAAAGDDVERGGAPGNRWPRQETLALLQIRSDMDSAFRDSTLKGPLWEEISRKLGGLGYRRSAKKCKEKFENVHKYYKRTKDSRAGRQDGKTYRFFTQLEALQTAAPASAGHAAVPTPPGIPTVMAGASSFRAPTEASPRAVPEAGASAAVQAVSGSTTPAAAAVATGLSFSSNTSSSESLDSDEEDMEGIGGAQLSGKRKRIGGGSGGSRKMMAFFEGVMKKVIERQEAMQQRFLEAIEKREQDRMIREETWRRQEMARLAREQEILVQERSMAATRDAAVISFIQKITGQTIPMPTIPTTTTTVMPPPPQPVPAPASSPAPAPQQKQPPQPPPPLPQPQQKPRTPLPHLWPHPQIQHHQSTDIVRLPVSSSTEIVAVPESQELVAIGGGFETGSTSSRWPKAEVHALINLRSGLESRYQEVGAKGQLWEEISAGMRRMGYNRNSKRCKEKWENINKYFKKVKESNKNRPEDSKTCPYFHQLDALYRSKQLGDGGGGGSAVVVGLLQRQQGDAANTNPKSQEQPSHQQPPAEPESKNGNNSNSGNGGGIQIHTGGGGSLPLKKPEDILKELMEQRRSHATMTDEHDSDNMVQDDVDFDDDNEAEADDDDDGKMQYKIQFQRPNVSAGGGGGSGGGGGGDVPNTTAAAGTAASSSFLAMV